MQKIFQKKVTIMKKEGEYKQVVETDMNPKNGNTLNGVYEAMSEKPMTAIMNNREQKYK